MSATLILVGSMALASCTAIGDAQAGQFDGNPYEQEYRHNVPPWQSPNSSSDRRREQDERAGYVGSSDPRYNPDGKPNNSQLRDQAIAEEQRQEQERAAAKRRQEAIWDLYGR